MPQVPEEPTVEFRLGESDVSRDPGSFFAELRQSCPVGRAPAFGGFWLLSRYDDVHDAARRPETFSSAQGISIPVNPFPPVLCLEQDDPEHAVWRALMRPWFAPPRIAAMEPAVRQVVTALIDQVVDDGRCDLARDVANPVPPIVIAKLLGLPESDWPWFHGQIDKFLALIAQGDVEASTAAVTELLGYLMTALDERRSNPRADMLSDIAQLKVDGEQIEIGQALSLALLLLIGGHETTMGAMGGLLYRVGTDPTLRDRLIAQPHLVVAAVEEALRLEPSLPGLGRVTTEETSVAGVTIPKGERVMLLYGSANRDPAVFDHPELFDIDRPNNSRHLTFGAGPHRCVGAPLGRLELRVVLEEVLRRMPRYRVSDPDAVEVHYAFSRVYRSLPAVW